ncbi:N-formylglutamate deformylase [Mesorhizobium sp. VNQ89]|uniref:N-formylglutamate deformylase n=1 Tax=Mesorhizobium quangtriensis TaxID=3157709 RepID=UPI0032B78B20
MSFVEFNRGTSPVILAFPHTGTLVPDDIADRLNDEGRKLRDTDWHINLLYGGLLPDATTVRATFHRYVIDANRDPTGASLYPGQNTTSLVPLTDFDNQPIWKEGQEPTEANIAERIALYHRPYHAALEAEIARVKALHGIAIVYDCHSIRSRCPFLFDGVLPDFNIGTDGGKTCAPEIERAVADICASAEGYNSVVNGRFRGGWTTRHYGKPETGVHAIQMELAQSTHLYAEEAPFELDQGKSRRLSNILTSILAAVQRTALELAGAAR